MVGGSNADGGTASECFVTANDLDAFRDLVERHGPMVLAVCRKVLRAQHDVERAFEDTFLALARRAHTIKHSETICPWLHRVALRLAQKARLEAPQMMKVVSVRPMRAIASNEAMSAVRIQTR